jgi:long-chain acyl-CoA synthetase
MGLSISVWRRAEITPLAAAVVTARGGHLTFADLVQEARNFQAAFSGIGLRRGDRVALLLSNSVAMLAATVAAFRSGLYAVPINHHLTPGEIKYILDDSDSQALVASRRFAAAAVAASTGLPRRSRLSVDGKIAGFDSLANVSGDLGVSDSGQSGTLMLYASGTTGRPRGVWRPLPETSPDSFAEDEADRFFSRFPPLAESHTGPHLVVGPMYHA